MEKFCSMAESIKIIGSKPRLLILRYLNSEKYGFNELKRLTKLSSRTLALNVKFLLERGVINKEMNKNRVKYSLTKEGKDFWPIIEKIGRWGNKWKIYKQ